MAPGPAQASRSVARPRAARAGVIDGPLTACRACSRACTSRQPPAAPGRPSADAPALRPGRRQPDGNARATDAGACNAPQVGSEAVHGLMSSADPPSAAAPQLRQTGGVNRTAGSPLIRTGQGLRQSCCERSFHGQFRASATLAGRICRNRRWPASAAKDRHRPRTTAASPSVADPCAARPARAAQD